MPTGVGVGFDDPALASLPPGGNIYFPADRTLVGKIPPTPIIEPSGGVSGPGWVQARDLYGAGSITPQAPSPVLLYGQGSSMTMGGEPVAHAAKSSRGHVSEIFNFHGSPAPWILLGILIVAGFLQLSASAKFGKGNPWVESLASILLMVLAIALIIAFIAGGTAGVGQWLHAKFVGEWAMPAVGIVLLLIGLWILVRTLRGGLTATLTRTSG